MEPARIGTRQLLTALAAVLLVEWVLYMAAGRQPGSRMALAGAARMIQAAAVILLAGRSISTGAAALGLSRDRLLRGAARGLVWSAGFGALSAAAALALSAAGIDPFDLVRAPVPRSRAGILWLFVVGGFISPFAEEVVFRGLLYGFFRRWGATPAVLASTALFTAAHLPMTSLPLVQTAGGLLFAISYEREGSLATPITIHILGNTAIFSLSNLL